MPKAKLPDKKVLFELEGLDGNAVFIMAKWAKAAKRQGWDEKEIDAVIAEAKSSTYDHVIQTIMRFSDDTDEDTD